MGTPNVYEPARAEQTLSFYDPTEPAADPASSLPFGDPPTDPSPFPVEAKPLPWAISESVYFLYRARRPGEPSGEPHPPQPPIASAFVLSVPDRAHHHYTRFLVTARHVVDPQWAHCSEQNPASINLRLNRRNGGVGYETVPLQAGTGRQFYTPADSTSDIAVVPLDNLVAKLDDYKLIDVPFRLLPTESEMRLIRADQQVMTARLSARPSGELGNYPVFEAGFLSKMPTEAVSVQCGMNEGRQSTPKPLHVWFISAGVPRGVTGAPVYASIARAPGTAKTPVLLGIQSVAWPDRGIAGITPSPALGGLIQSSLRANKLNLDFYQGPDPQR